MSRKKNKQSAEAMFKPRRVSWKTDGQREYIRNVLHHTVNFATGPAGTGKTHIAVGLAVAALQAAEIESIVMTRPLVGVGRDMGYLPGSVNEKVGPYVQPCFDELTYYLSGAGIRELMMLGVLKIVPLSMMRGRTFNDSFVILDEAQNCNRAELKTFLTRLGKGSKMIIAGDANQSDIGGPDAFAFTDAIGRLGHLDMVSVSELGPEDIVRNPMISDILRELW